MHMRLHARRAVKTGIRVCEIFFIFFSHRNDVSKISVTKILSMSIARGWNYQVRTVVNSTASKDETTLSDAQ